jgi:hypothetical protein
MLRKSLAYTILIITLVVYHPAFAENEAKTVRFATYNIAMGLESQGELLKRLQAGNDESLRKAAAVIQQVRPDVLLLNEFDYTPDIDAGRLFVTNYLEKPQFGRQPISYSYTFNGPVNTGVESGLDLDNNGKTGDPADAWGFGRFPGQYAMQVLSRLPLKNDAVRTFQHFLWTDMPDALSPLNPDGSPWYPAGVQQQMRLSSKSHWDIPIVVGTNVIHFLVSHPTPPVFDGEEDRNGTRNHDEIRLWVDYLQADDAGYIYDDAGAPGGLEAGAQFVIAGDLNADPIDGDSYANSINQLLNHARVDSSCVPTSEGAEEASRMQAGKNLEHQANPDSDTGDFNDKYVGNMRIDYVLPSDGLKVIGCGVFWPAEDQDGYKLIGFSDHRLVWVDVVSQ